MPGDFEVAVSRHPSRGGRSNSLGDRADRAEFNAAESAFELTKTNPGAMICLQGYTSKDRAAYDTEVPTVARQSLGSVFWGRLLLTDGAAKEGDALLSGWVSESKSMGDSQCSPELSRAGRPCLETFCLPSEERWGGKGMWQAQVFHPLFLRIFSHFC